MKRTLLTIASVLTMTAVTLSQNVVRSQDGNYIATTQVKASTDSITGLTYTDGTGKVEPVFVGAKGGHYVCRTSAKTGKFYRKYLKTESND